MKKFSIESIIAILILHLMVINIYYLNFYSELQYVIIFSIGIYLLQHSKFIMSKQNISIKILMLLFGSIVIISSIINRHVSVTPITGFIYTLKVWQCILFFLIVNKKNKFWNVIKIFYRLSLVYVILTDILIIFFPKMKILYGNNYLIGNKFEVVYLHFFLICLYMLDYKKKIYTIEIRRDKKVKIYNKIGGIFLWVLTLIVSLIVECSTGVVGCIIIAIFVCLKGILANILNKWWVFLIATAFFNSIMFLWQSMLNNYYVEFFITQFLNKDLSLTGRTVIYSKILPVVSKQLWFGYGQGNAYYVVKNSLKVFPNAQNGILQCIINFGVLGVIFMITMFCLILYKKNTSKVYPIIIMIYLYVIISAIEITFELNMIVLFSILCGIIKDNTRVRNNMFKENIDL